MTELLAILRKIHAEHGAFLQTPDTCLAMLREDAPTEAEMDAAIISAIDMAVSPVTSLEAIRRKIMHRLNADSLRELARICTEISKYADLPCGGISIMLDISAPKSRSLGRTRTD